jgi:hypothetical protein
VLSFRAEVVERNPDAVRRFLQAWDRAVAAIRANPEKYAGLLAEKQLVPQPLMGTYRLPPYPDRALPTREQFAGRDRLGPGERPAAGGHPLRASGAGGSLKEDPTARTFRGRGDMGWEHLLPAHVHISIGGALAPNPRFR